MKKFFRKVTAAGFLVGAGVVGLGVWAWGYMKGGQSTGSASSAPGYMGAGALQGATSVTAPQSPGRWAQEDLQQVTVGSPQVLPSSIYSTRVGAVSVYTTIAGPGR